MKARHLHARARAHARAAAHAPDPAPIRAAELLHRTDWSATPLGPMSHWPRSLRSLVTTILELPSPAIIFWGPQQTQIYNDGYALIMGPRHPRYFGAPYRECWPDTYPVIHPWMRRVLDDGEVIEVERERIPVTRYGFEEDAYFSFTFSPLRDDDGRIAGILQPVFEVTDAVLSERRSALLAELTPDRRALCSPGEVLQVLQRASDDVPQAALYLAPGLDDATTGAGAAALACIGQVGAPPWDDAQRAFIDAAAQRACHDGMAVQLETPAALVLPLAGDDDSRRAGALALALNPRLHLDERHREFLEGIARHTAAVLQRLSAQRALARQRDQLHELFVQAPAAIALLEGPRHVVRLCNPRYQALIGDRPLVGRPLVEAVPELVGRPFLATLSEVYTRGVAYVGTQEPAQIAPAPGVAADARYDYVCQPLADPGGGTGSILVFCYEVTEQVRARQRAESLAEALMLEHRRKDEFLAMLAHELRNPLAPIAAAAELLRSHRAEPALSAQATATIVRQVRHMAELLSDLLDVSRVTRGLVEIERQREDMVALVQDAVEQVRPLMVARQHRFELGVPVPPDEAPVVVGDRKRLVQIVANLLTNAARYTPEGGRIELVVTADGDAVTVTVADNGIGIAPTLLPHLFELFVQAERSRDRRLGGLGIGLGLVKRLTELHGGTVEAESAGPGHGSRFRVRLPRAPVAAPGPATGHESRPAPETAPGRCRVMIVDDNVDAAQMLALVLRADGHDVNVEHDAPAALQAAAALVPEVLLLDIGLPEVDGYALARRLRRQASTATSLLVAVTGYGQPADRERARDAGFDHYLVKPVDRAALDEILRQALAGRAVCRADS